MGQTNNIVRKVTRTSVTMETVAMVLPAVEAVAMVLPAVETVAMVLSAGKQNKTMS